jgi:predicted hotdog family 3-hydroxylacyl-ACP dehydratase
MSLKQKSTLPCPAAHLVPHDKPMLLVDMVIQIADDGDPESFSIVEATTPDTGIFLNNNLVLHEYLIELMAQSIAAVDGFKSTQNPAKPAKPAKGFLAGIDDFMCHSAPAPGTRLQIKLKKNFSFGSFFIFAGSITAENEILATGLIKIWKEDSQ